MTAETAVHCYICLDVRGVEVEAVFRSRKTNLPICYAHQTNGDILITHGRPEAGERASGE